ncbi:putative phosphoesterase [Escherichia phage vB_EcoS_VAH1]|uniref:Putative phosphoesterase n=1 Tax=Escherichia phage vB_EcoS_VAH1 TaxID=2508173 RepID=A0A482N5D6_9CAUD|nr:putative phosphoesterase [Escherichia phage vB_EcoS_VAH1]
MKVKFWSDLHLDHPGALRFRPWFKNMKEHDEYILDTLSKHIGKRTKLILLGDIAVGREGLAKLKSVYPMSLINSLWVIMMRSVKD